MNRFTNITATNKIMLGIIGTCGFIGSVSGAFLGVECGLHVMNIVRYQLDDKIASKSVNFKLAYVGANMIGLPVIGAICGMIVGASAPVSLPITYGVYKFYNYKN